MADELEKYNRDPERRKEFDDDMDDTMMMVMMMTMGIMVMAMFLSNLPVVRAAESYFESQAYEGQSDPRILHVTDKKQTIVLETPWVGGYFVNKGSCQAAIALNGTENYFYLDPRETVNFTRLGARDRVYAITYYCTMGEHTTVEAVGDY